MIQFDSELSRYPLREVPLPQPTPEDWVGLEAVLQFRLPEALKDFYAQVAARHFEGDLPSFSGRGTDGDDWTTVLHRERALVENPIPAGLVPFCGVGNGDHHCFRILDRDANEYDVVYWYHDWDASKQMRELHVIAPDFVTWLRGYVQDDY